MVRGKREQLEGADTKVTINEWHTLGLRAEGERFTITFDGGRCCLRLKPLSCDPARIKGMSERLIVSHYENNYGGAVKRLNLIEEQLAELDYAKRRWFLINGLKREQLIAMNSMILHELFFDGLATRANRAGLARRAHARFRLL